MSGTYPSTTNWFYLKKYGSLTNPERKWLNNFSNLLQIKIEKKLHLVALFLDTIIRSNTGKICSTVKLKENLRNFDFPG